MTKDKKPRVPEGVVAAVHINILGIKALAQQLGVSPYELAVACSKAGMMLQADVNDLSNDAAKVILYQERGENGK